MTSYTLVTDLPPDPLAAAVSVSSPIGTCFSITGPAPAHESDRLMARVTSAGDHYVGDAQNSMVRWIWERLTAETTSVSAAVNACRVLWPLVMTGPSGVGKSLLARCFAAQLQTLISGEIVQTTVDDLVRTFHAAGDVNAVDEWVSRHERAAVLVVDQVGRLADFPTVQLLLCEIIDQRIEAGLPTIFLSVESLGHCRLVDRLASRLTQGLCCPVTSPGPDAMAVLIRMAFARLGVPIADDQVRWLWASGLRSVSTLHQIASRWLLDRGRVPFDGSVVSDSIKSLLGCSSPPPVTPDVILRMTAKFFQLSVKDLRGSSRAMTCSRARALAMWICRQHLKLSYQQIGDLFGNRDHSTVLSSCKKIDASLPNDAFLQNALQQLLFRLAF
jgi:chromosomal replication initiator protein